MILGIMQPYFLPYLGYFQLINAVDKFIIYDDVNYINKGWINRNNILVNAKPHLLVLPLKEASQNKLINEIYVTQEEKQINSILKTIEFNYKKAPFFKDVFLLLEDKIKNKGVTIAEYNANILQAICKYLNIGTDFIISSLTYNNTGLHGQDRILYLCLQEAANHYINPIGGMELYSNSLFLENNIKLNFIKTKRIEYKQFQHEFISGLSILDVMMFNSPQEINIMLDQYELL